MLFPAWFAPGTLATLSFFPTVKLFLTLFGFALLFAMLRYRLWDIDRIINRTLVYTLLTGVLGLIYTGLIYFAQELFFMSTGQARENSLVLVISTLLIVVLFRPVQQFIQRQIDRRFYRQKYNADQIMSDFTTTLRAVVDLPELEERLIQTIEQTMQPASLSLWLLPHQEE
jgi:hypothetical protein